MEKDYNKIMNYLISLEGIRGTTSPRDTGILGNGLSLKSIDILNNRDNYCYLYKDNKLINKNIYRLGGLSSGFNNMPYCNLIYYGVSTSKLKDATKIGHFGSHCIIDTNGNKVFESTDSFESVYYLQGVIAVQKNVYYNLLTGKVIVEGSSNLKSTNFLFVEHSSNFSYNKYPSPIGVYKINWNTGEYEIFE